MKKLFYIFIFFFTFLVSYSYSQPYGNEWINYSQQYYKINVCKNGIYRINYTALITAGIPTGSFDPRSFQIFNNGTEQHIYIKGENDGIFNTNDYIEFYAEKNDGWLDAQLYDAPSSQVNTNYSLFTDTATYYLTWNSSINNKRMLIENDVNFSGYTPLSYFFKISRQDYTNRYFYGKTNNYGVTDPEYTSGEGWFDNGFSMGGGITREVNTTNVYNSGPNASINFVVIGASEYSGLNPDHHLKVQFADIIIDTLYEGYVTRNFNYTTSPDNLDNPNTSFLFSSISIYGNQADRNTVAYISIKYPHTFNLENLSNYYLYIPNSAQPKDLLNFSNFNIETDDTARLYDLTNHKRIKVNKNGSYYSALIPNTGLEKTCYLTSENQTTIINSVTPVSDDISNYAKFTDYTIGENINSDYIIITHKSLWTECVNYKNYRNSTGYKTLLVDIDDLYDQYSYGIRKHPLAIRNFLHYAIDNFTNIPEHLFLIGKSYKAIKYRKNSYYFNNTLVPTFGNPPSDILFTSGITDTLYYPAIPTGRLSAKTLDHVRLYLNKVILYEAAQMQPEEWMKNILHFGGGANLLQQSTFAYYLNKYKDIIEDTLFGGFVRTFLKTSSAPIQFNLSDSLKDIINNGVSLMTFFGHAAGIGFDQSIDNPSEYNNYGKYPFLLANSCWAGDIFGTGESSSEAFMLIENKGMIGFLASVTAAATSYLNTYSKEFYKNISYLNYGKPVGKCIRQTIKTNEINNPDNIYIKEIALEMTLHGDPAIIINSHDKPDYMIIPPNVYFTPENVTSEIDSFDINIISTNIGRAVNDSFIVEVIRTFPDGITSKTYLKKIKATYFKDTLSFKLSVDFINGLGLNTFKITLDVFDEIDETDNFFNNTTTVNLLIKSADIVPVYPYKYAIIPTDTITLKASTGDPFSAPRDYVFEIDTTDAFNSPFINSTTINHSGGVVTWKPPIIFTDSTVYYWRVSVDSGITSSYNWRESSFQYIQDKRGWGQAHFFQFKNDRYQYVKYNKPERKFDFVNDIKSLSVQTGYYPYIAWNEEWFKLNGSVLDTWNCVGDQQGGMKFAVFNPVNGEPWMSHNLYSGFGQFGNVHCHLNTDVACFDFYSGNSGWRDLMENLFDSIPQGYYVLVYSHENHYAEDYDEELYQGFESIGSNYIRTIHNKMPYIIFGKKGDNIGDANEQIGGSIQSIITLTDSFTTNWNQGFIESELIGPASKWGSLHWRQHSAEGMPTDSVLLSVIGIKLSGDIDTITTLNGLPPDSGDIYNLYDHIDADIYPYMKLIAFMRDDSMHTPSQMDRWQVIYDGVPETALDPCIHYSFYKDTINQGEKIIFSTATHNISDYDFIDSLLVHYWIIDKDRIMHTISYKKLRPHPSGDILIDTVFAPVNGLSGLNSLWIEVNPVDTATGLYDQLEQYHFNNIGSIYFFVDVDKTNPMLDVTFDGVHILDGDIVSAKPEILITLNDENKFLALDDTSLFRIFIQSPSSSTPKRIYFDTNGVKIMEFIPASLPNNTCKIEYNPTLTEDGTYKLFIQAEDRSYNISGEGEGNIYGQYDYDYKISFEVINKSTITQVLNWPNPFSTATHFVFTLTGDEIPTYFKIQIMTITGKIVREINQDQLGPIHIGRNITQYAWDGKDEYGDQLANGVYLYRVLTNLHGKEIEKNNIEGINKYFTKGFGKMYLIR